MRKMILVVCAGLGCQAKSLVNGGNELLSDAAIDAEGEAEAESESEAESEAEGDGCTAHTDCPDFEVCLETGQCGAVECNADEQCPQPGTFCAAKLLCHPDRRGEGYTCTTDECGSASSPGRRNSKDCFCNATTLEYDDWCADSKEAFCRTCPEECSTPRDDAGPDAPADAGEDAPRDAGSDRGPDLGPDAPPDAGSDSGPDAGPDGGEGEAEAEAESEGECSQTGWVARQGGRGVLVIQARGFADYPDGMPCAVLVGEGPMLDWDRGLAVARSVAVDGASVYGFRLAEMADILEREAEGVYRRVTYVGLPESYCATGGEYTEVTDLSEAVWPNYIGDIFDFLACFLSGEGRAWLCELDVGDGCATNLAFEYSVDGLFVPMGVEVCANPETYDFPPREEMESCPDFHEYF